jgi:hypothetical protein
MFKGLCTGFVATLFWAFAATSSRAESVDIICSNMGALNSQFVFLLAKHLHFEPSVIINPRRQNAISSDDVRTVRLVVSGGSYESVVACAVGHKFERDELDQKIGELRRRLGNEGQPVFPGGPRGRLLSVGEAVKLNGQQFFISVSGVDDLMVAGAAVAQSHNVDSQACWFDNECLVAAETYWSRKAN